MRTAIIIFTLFILPFKASAGDMMSLDQVGTGNLLIRTETPGQYLSAPSVTTDVKINVTGTIARTVVTQRFENPADAWVEAVYAFPLPEESAVDTLRMRIGDRFIEGQVKECEEARQVYEQAKADGKKASLVEQQRPNLFTNEVANIGPGEVVVVQIEYQEAVRIDDGAFHLRFPMVVGPRYMPPARMASVRMDGKTHHVLADPVPDRAKISPPVAHPDTGHINSLTLSVELDPGFPLAELETPFHQTSLDRRDDGSVFIALADGVVPANRDFEITWRAKQGTEPHINLFKEVVGDQTYLLLTLVPPEGGPVEPGPRDLMIVIDVSGSMSGASIIQAKAAALSALDTLKPHDRLNVIAVASGYAEAFSYSRVATPQNVAAARSFINGLRAGGGTELLPAILRALDTGNGDETGLLRQVVFITDGGVGNEEELFQAIAAKLGDTRMFTVGIGSAPNSYFMNRAARIGRGTYSYIGSPKQVKERMAALFRKLESPMLTGITARWPSGGKTDAWPDPIPDLYAAEPVVLSSKLTDATGTLSIDGTLAGRAWRTDINLIQAKPGKGVAKLWARGKIAGLMEQRYRSGDRGEAEAHIIELALEHHLVSAHTSLVAVDVTPSRPQGDALYRKDVPLMLPEGWEWEGVFGEPGRMTPMPDMSADVMAMISTQPPSQTAPVLPQGSTPAALQMLIGSLLLVLGIAFLSRQLRMRAA